MTPQGRKNQYQMENVLWEFLYFDHTIIKLNDSSGDKRIIKHARIKHRVQPSLLPYIP